MCKLEISRFQLNLCVRTFHDCKYVYSILTKFGTSILHYKLSSEVNLGVYEKIILKGI
jgi:hypothetical protein